MSKVSILCPYCFTPFDRNAVQMQCVNKTEKQEMTEQGISRRVPQCPPIDDEKYNNHWGTQTKIKRIFNANLTFGERFGWKSIQAKRCPVCDIETQKFVCPHCHNWLPAEMIEKGSEIISVVGGPASGKSNYIVSLIHQLMKYQNKLGLSVTLQQVGRNDEEKTSNMYKAAKKKIFEEKEALQKTQETKNPIPWIIRLESRATKKAAYLVFYDTAGESFRDTEKMERDALYFRYSRAVIVAFDTLAIPKIKKVLEDKGIENYTEAYDYKEMWNTIKAFSQSHKSYKLNERPYAFVFTKFDAVIDNCEDLNCTVDTFLDDDDNFKNSQYITDGDGLVSKEEMKENSDAIESYLREPEIWDEESFVTDIKEEWGENGQFFGVSALGGMTDSAMEIQTKGDGEIKPIRVLDPLVWILIKLGDFGIKCK